MAALVLTGNPVDGIAAEAESIHVLHWWTSDSEKHAVDAVAARLASAGVGWKDGAVPGGAGLGAGKVLKLRVIAGSAPDVTQMNGAAIDEWAEMGMLLELDAPAKAGDWETNLFPTVWNLVRKRGHTVAAPLGIHRLNTLFYNRKILASLGMTPPSSWAALEKMVPQMHAAGISPFVQSSEPWQIAALFENIVLSVGGADFYRELFVHQNARAASDQRLASALIRLRKMKSWMSLSNEEPWTDTVHRFARGEGAMLVMGDWAKAELNEIGLKVDAEFSCTAMPGTDQLHLYGVDTLAMLTNDYSHSGAQEILARVINAAPTQLQYNTAKGSVPVRRDVPIAGMDSCARSSWTTFARGAPVQVPSLVHRMAAGEETRDVIIDEIRRYFIDDSMSPAQVQRRLASVFRIFSSRPRGKL